MLQASKLKTRLDEIEKARKESKDRNGNKNLEQSPIAAKDPDPTTPPEPQKTEKEVK